MSTIGDSSQMSAISGISGISRSSNIRPAKFDSVFNTPECQASGTMREVINRSTVSGSIGLASNISQILKLIKSCEAAMANCAKLKLFYDCVRNVAQSYDGAIHNDISVKCRDILTTHEANKYLQLPNVDKNNHGDLSLLGITADLPKCHLSHDEKRDISTAVERIFREKMNIFIDSYKKTGGDIEEVLKSHESAGKTGLMESHETDTTRWNDSMNEICTEYCRDLLTCADLLSQWQRLKYIEMKLLNEKNAENLLLQAQVAEVQANISRKTCAWRMFTETTDTIDAVGILKDRLDARILDTREKIHKKKILKMTYADVSSTEYNQLLNKYTELCGVIRKKEHLMEMV